MAVKQDKHGKYLSMNAGKGKMYFALFGRCECKKYVGKFSGKELQSLADTGLWYSLVSGNPHPIRGEGDTPLEAIRDSISRTNSRIKEMQQGVTALESRLEAADSWKPETEVNRTPTIQITTETQNLE